MTPARTPVIAITGYLGAGKTSLLNHLLRQPGARLGVIVNDFGQLNVDATLLSGQVDAAVPISGGCLCCLPDAGGLDDALASLADPRLGLDAILVEASGVANPLTLAGLIHASGVRGVRPAGVIEVIDAVEHRRTIGSWLQPPARYRAATLVAISKADLVGEEDRDAVLAEIRAVVRERNPEVGFVLAHHGRIDPALVFDIAAREDAQPMLPLVDAAAVGHVHARSASVQVPGPISASALVDLLENPPTGAYRIKGRVSVRGARSAWGYDVHLVGRRVHVEPRVSAPPVGELVAIGLDLDAAAAQVRLDAVAATAGDGPDVNGLNRLQRYRRLSA